jgi:hypothetical protein
LAAAVLPCAVVVVRCDACRRRHHREEDLHQAVAE